VQAVWRAWGGHGALYRIGRWRLHRGYSDANGGYGGSIATQIMSRCRLPAAGGSPPVVATPNLRDKPRATGDLESVVGSVVADYIIGSEGPVLDSWLCCLLMSPSLARSAWVDDRLESGKARRLLTAGLKSQSVDMSSGRDD